MNTDGIDYKARYEELASALGIDCGAPAADGIDHAAALEQARIIKGITDGVPDACVDVLRSIIDAASASGYRSKLRDMVKSASDRAADLGDVEATKASGSPLTHLFGKTGPNLSSSIIPNIDKVFEIMAAADASRAAEAKAPTAQDRLSEIIETAGADAVLALVEAVGKLPAGEWWLDEGRPWRLMVNLNAVAEDEDLYLENDSAAVMALFDHDNYQRGTVGDGEPAHLKAILRVLEAASALHVPRKAEKTTAILEIVSGDKR